MHLEYIGFVFLFFPLEKGGGELLGKKVLMYVKNSKVVSTGNH